ncbi:hypothetical protein [Nocardia sp. R7R-8]|uniref:hypothetical protein n=1 Tax=Nocardia sp. R7R-8 TaxID=3459304 RepID=UPI00403D97F3
MIRVIDAADGWVLNGPAADRPPVDEAFDGGRAVIRVIEADGTLRALIVRLV